MAITGSQPSYMYALGGYARGGATRGGDTDPQTYITIAGVHVGALPAVAAQHVVDGTLSIAETEGETPNTASFQVMGFQPTDGQEVIMTQGSKNNLDRLFAGTILTDAHSYVGTPANYNEGIHVIDYTWQLTRDTFSQRWQTTSATVIAQAIIAKAAGRGIASTSVAAGLPVLDEFTVTNQTPAQALSALAARIGGYWKTLYRSRVAGARADVRFGITTDTGQTDPTTLTVASAALTRMENFSVTRDLGQVITRQPVEGGGGTALVPVAVGATVLPVGPDATWYNPLGGTVVSGPQRVTYTGLGLGYTPVVNNWQTQTGPIAARSWTGVAWSPTLSLFVAVAGDATSSDVMTSTDGIAWTTRAPAASHTWRAIIWAPGLALFVAVSQDGFVMTSPDGITWTSRTAAAANGWQAIEWSPALGLLVAVSNTGASRVMTSPDGITWTSRTAAAALTWQGVTWAPTLGLFAACAFGGGVNCIMTSPDGITWTQRTTPTTGYNAIAWSPSLALFVALGGTGGVGVTTSSPDGITWTARVAANGNSWEDVIWVADLSLFVAVSNDGVSSSANRIMASPDGISWTGYTTPAVGAWYGLAWAQSLAKLAAVGFVTGGVIQAMTSQALTYRTLTGVPASGAGSILYPIKAGDPVNLRVVIDDTAAQAVIAAMMLPTVDDGIIEGTVIQDGRLSETEARARGTAQLALRSAIDVAVTYDTRDKNTHASRTAGVNLPSPTSVVGSFKLQSVTIDTFTPAQWPIAHAHGASKRKTLEDLLREARNA